GRIQEAEPVRVRRRPAPQRHGQDRQGGAAGTVLGRAGTSDRRPVAMARDLSGHVTLITGGNGGIGLGMARALAEAGADVAIWGTNPAKNEAAGEQLRATGRRVVTSVCDVRDEGQVAE